MFHNTFEVTDHQLPYVLSIFFTQRTLKMVDSMNVKWHGTFIFPTNCRLFKDKVLPGDNLFPGSCKEAKKMLKIMGVGYISYHAYTNYCILYRGEYANKEICPKCEHGRYQEYKIKAKAHGPPHKILRHIPMIPRIQRLFRCKELAML